MQRTRSILTSVVVLAGLAGLALASPGGAPGNPVTSPVQVLAEGLEEQEEISAPFDALLSRHLLGSDPELAAADVFAAAAADAAALGEATAAADPDLAAAEWRTDGPVDIGGRILDVVADVANPDWVFAAAASGGVWLSTDAGATFEERWPRDVTQAIGALTMGSDGTLWAGTGETGPGGGSLSYGGDGVYRSRDRGLTWEHVGLEGTSRIGRVVVDPSNPDRVFVAASGNLFRPTEERGLYLTEDGGETWSRILRGDNATTGAADVAVNPVNPDIVYAAMWDHQREPDLRRYNGMGSGLYRSTDGGDSWERIGVGILGPREDLSRIGVAVAPSDPDVVYVTAAGTSGAYAGAFRSDDGGDTFTPIVHPFVVQNNMVYGWWFGRVYVDPLDAYRVWHLGLNLIVSNDGGVNFSTSGGVHADQHGMAWDALVPGRVYLGNDGGVYRSDQNGGGWQFAQVQPYSQLYSFDVGQQDPSRHVAGLQDNGVNRNYNDAGEVGEAGTGWNSYVGGDGERATINPSNQGIVYGCYQYGECSVSYNGGNSTSSFTTEVVSSRKNWLTPIELDPFVPSTLYTGGELMSVSHDDARTWALLSPQDFTNGSGRETNPLFRNYGTLTTIAPAGDTVYAGTDDGNLWYSHDAGTTWAQATDADLPGAWVTRVEVNPLQPDEAFVTYSGFRQGRDAAYVLRTTDGGRSWTDISAGLPLAPLNDVLVIGEHLVVGGDVGVFVSRDRGATWLALGNGLPLSPVHELRWHEPSHSLYAGTFGRGLWRVGLPALSNAATHAGTWLGPADQVPGATSPAAPLPLPLPLPLG